MARRVEKVTKTIRTNAETVEAIRTQLDEAAVVMSKNNRLADRFDYHKTGLIAIVQQPDDSVAQRFLVIPRNLSEGGMSFFHGGFIHNHSACAIQLVTVHGKSNVVPGLVVGCQYVSEGIHEIHVKFHHKIQPAQYCPSALKFRVLVAEDDQHVANLMVYLLAKAHATTDVATNGKIAVEMATASTYDLILMDIEMPELDGLSATQALRHNGYSGQIVAATAMTRPEDRERCLDAGCNGFIEKPHTRESIAMVLNNTHREPLYSHFAGDTEMDKVIELFVSAMPSQIRRFEEATAKKDVAELIELARNIKANGTSFGFNMLSEISSAIELKLLEGAPIDDVRADLTKLIALCSQVRSYATAELCEEEVAEACSVDDQLADQESVQTPLTKPAPPVRQD